LNNSLFGFFWALFLVLAVFLVVYHISRTSKVYTYNKVRKTALVLLGVGLLLLGLGNVVWSVYNIFLSIEVPFPSYADVFYSFSYTATFIGLGKLLSNKFFKSEKLKFCVIGTLRILSVFVSVSPVVLTTAIKFSKSPLELETLRLTLNYYYVTMDILILILILTLFIFASNYLVDHLNKKAKFLLTSAFLFLFIGDLLFFNTSMNNTYFNGCYVDLFYVSYAFLLFLGICETVDYWFPLASTEERFNGVNYVYRIQTLREFCLNVIESDNFFSYIFPGFCLIISVISFL